MPAQHSQADPQPMAFNDPRRPLKVRRLREARERIAELETRSPQLSDPDYKAWDQTVQSLLQELFGAGEFLLRFRRITIHPVIYSISRGAQWHGDAPQTWRTGLKLAATILDEALEEAGLEPPDSAEAARTPSQPPVVVNVQNHNVFSAAVHVTVSQLIERLDTLDLTEPERGIATEQLRELQAETEGPKRWPVIARSLESLKSLGKNVYKDVAVPLIVEFLKKEAGLSAS